MDVGNRWWGGGNPLGVVVGGASVYWLEGFEWKHPLISG